MAPLLMAQVSPEDLEALEQRYDTLENDTLREKLRRIKADVRRIDLISDWTEIKKAQLWKSAEGGEATYYFNGQRLEKIKVHQLGETRQSLSEFYLLNEKLFFLLVTSYEYNRPIYWDSTAMLENNDTEVFNMASSKKTEIRTYFENGEVIYETWDGVLSPYLFADPKSQSQYYAERMQFFKELANKPIK